MRERTAASAAMEPPLITARVERSGMDVVVAVDRGGMAAGGSNVVLIGLVRFRESILRLLWKGMLGDREAEKAICSL